MNKIENALYIVPTPIGNLADISQRALDVLNNVDIVACEDTRRAGILFQQLKIQKSRFISYHIVNESERAANLIDEIKKGNSIALISDAGTPAISDPGYRIIKIAIENDIKVIPLPGATAFVPALAASGFATNKFAFLGFPPHKKGRKTFVKEALEIEFTVVLYESPHRVQKLINEIIEIEPERNICIAREISKMFEEFIRGSALEIKDVLDKKDKIKGEFVVVIEGKKEK
jgi:16S rRNA (cytidine1402-2'-O)-methyltransferase